MDMSVPCWHCPSPWWIVATFAVVSASVLGIALLLLRNRSPRWRAAGGLLSFLVAFLYLITTVSTLRYGINTSGSYEEPRQHIVEAAVLGLLYVITGFLIFWHVRAKRHLSARTVV